LVDHVSVTHEPPLLDDERDQGREFYRAGDNRSISICSVEDSPTSVSFVINSEVAFEFVAPDQSCEDRVGLVRKDLSAFSLERCLYSSSPIVGHLFGHWTENLSGFFPSENKTISRQSGVTSAVRARSAITSQYRS
jgi:hypothetical protein